MQQPAKEPEVADRTSTSTRSQPTESPLTLLFPDLESELATTRRMLERVPDGNDDFRPHKKSRSLGELAGHLAQLPGFGIMMTTNNEFDGATQRPPEPKFANSSDRVKMFDDLSGKLRNSLQRMTWDQARSPWTLRIGDRVIMTQPRANVLRTVFLTHSAHHRAQLGVYLRMLDVSVPWSYGESADERPPGPPS